MAIQTVSDKDCLICQIGDADSDISRVYRSSHWFIRYGAPLTLPAQIELVSRFHLSGTNQLDVIQAERLNKAEASIGDITLAALEEAVKQQGLTGHVPRDMVITSGQPPHLITRITPQFLSHPKGLHTVPIDLGETFGNQFVANISDITQLFRMLFPQLLATEIERIDLPS